MTAHFRTFTSKTLLSATAVSLALALTGCNPIELFAGSGEKNGENNSKASETSRPKDGAGDRTMEPAEPADVVNTESHTVGSVQLELPEHWVKRESNAQSIVGGMPIEFEETFFAGDLEARERPEAVLMAQLGERQLEEPASHALLTETMAGSVEDTRAASDEEYFGFTSQRGLYCDNPADWEITKPIELTGSSGEPGYHHAMEYEFRCESAGEQVWGWNWTGYAEDTRHSTISLTATMDYYLANREEFDFIRENITVPETLPE